MVGVERLKSEQSPSEVHEWGSLCVVCVVGKGKGKGKGWTILYILGSVVDFEGIDGSLYRIARYDTSIASSDKQRIRYESSD